MSVNGAAEFSRGARTAWILTLSLWKCLGTVRRWTMIVLQSFETILPSDIFEQSYRKDHLKASQNDLEALPSPQPPLRPTLQPTAWPIVLSRRSVLLDKRRIDKSRIEVLSSTLATSLPRRDDGRDRCRMMRTVKNPADSSGRHGRWA
jgi:hypothetical protein